jgi:hypothetical protein
MKHIIKNILKEAALSRHLGERFYDRFLNTDLKQVGYEVKNSFGEYVPLGEKRLDVSVIQGIKNRLDRIATFNFPSWKSYAVKLVDLRINPNTDKIYWDFDGAIDELGGKTLIYLDEGTESNGDLIYVIVRDNKVMTIFFAKSYIQITPQKLKVDTIIDEFEKIYDLSKK